MAGKRGLIAEIGLVFQQNQRGGHVADADADDAQSDGVFVHVGRGNE